MKKTILYVVFTVFALFFGLSLGYWAGTQTWVEDDCGKWHHFSTEEARLNEVRLAGATIDALHVLFRHDTAYWYDVFMETREYEVMDSIRNGDWEDFYLY